jgi:hypothetical protein
MINKAEATVIDIDISTAAIMQRAERQKMTCCSGRHAWIDRTSRERCCNPAWRRDTRLFGEHIDLDQAGRVYSDGFVFGWVRTS